ncbi:MAG TPA: hypothetical protein VF021_03090 [Longimicrobiales bacterium]
MAIGLLLQELGDFVLEVGWRAALAFGRALHRLLERLAELKDRVATAALLEMALDLGCVREWQLVVEVFVNTLERFATAFAAHTTGLATG